MSPRLRLFHATVWTTLLLGLGVPAATALWASLTWPLIHDAPIMHYIAWRIAQGAVPYRDIFDMNQPGVYAVHLAVLRVLGETDVAWRLFDLLVLVWTALVIRAFAGRWGRAASAAAALFFVAYHLMGGAWHMGERDFLLCPLLLSGALGVVLWLEGDRTRWWPLLLSGVALGAAITIKPHTALFAVGVAAVAAIVSHRSARLTWTGAAAYLSGLALPSAAAVLWLAGVGALDAWRRIMVDYVVPLYSHVGRAHGWPIFQSPLWAVILATVVVSIVSAATAGRFGVRHGVAGLGVLYGIAHYFGQGKAWPYHLYPLVAFAAVLVFSELQPAFDSPRHLRAIPLIIGVATVTVMLGIDTIATLRSDSVWDKEAIIRQAVDDVGARAKAGDTVQVLDTAEGGLHALLRLHLRQPTRFVYDFHFFHDAGTPTIRGLRSEFIDDVRGRPPRVFLVFRDAWPAGGYDRLERFPELSEYLRAYYTIAERRRWFTVFERRALQSRPGGAGGRRRRARR